MKKVLFILLIFIIVAGANYLGGKNILFTTKNENLEKISDIAYDSKNDTNYRVYIKEKENDTKYTPFLVLTSNYNDACLLIREHLLDDLQEYNKSSEYGSYYKDSEIDKYLNKNYFNSLSKRLQEIIITTDLEIATKNAIDTHKKENEVIKRKIFLLSATEINASLTSTTVKEGKELLYFKNIDNRIRTYENGEADTWLLRRAALCGGNSIITVISDGGVGIAELNGVDGPIKISVMPAFCVDKNTPIVKRDDLIEGQTVFCIQ